MFAANIGLITQWKSYAFDVAAIYFKRRIKKGVSK